MAQVILTLAMDQPRANPALLVRIPGALCALPLAEVIEIMRPLPIEPLAIQSDFVQGVARIRGAAVPVVQLTALFQGDGLCDLPTRFVTLRVGQRCVALAVQSVVGVADLERPGFRQPAAAAEYCTNRAHPEPRHAGRGISRHARYGSHGARIDVGSAPADEGDACEARASNQPNLQTFGPRWRSGWA